jgi:DNA-binding GntR family transcriptional regulator
VDNSIVAGFYTSLSDRLMQMIGESTVGDPQLIATIIDENRAIAGAVRDGSVEQALQAVKIHHASTLRALGTAADPHCLDDDWSQ